MLSTITAFLQSQIFPFETFFNYFTFFFKLSAACREDYIGVVVVTGIAAEFSKKFGATWWLSMKTDMGFIMHL